MDGMVSEFNIGSRRIGPGQPCFIIAEAGVNHNGDLALAMRLIDAAVAAGADAVKFQTFKAERLVTGSAGKAAYQQRTTAAAEAQIAMLRRLELTPGMHTELLVACRERSMLFLSTPFEEQSADLLEQLDLPLFKVPSGELTNLPFLQHLARKGRPLILSTGMSTLGEVETAVATIAAAGTPPLALLHCTTQYPTPMADVNLRAMTTLATAFGLPVGYSDHTVGITVPIAAVALGACIVEKHFTIDRSLPGPDHAASLEPAELRAMVAAIRATEAALGDGVKRPMPSEAACAPIARKSLIAARDLPAGTRLRAADLVIKRPGTGLSPALRDHLVGLTLTCDVAADMVLQMAHFQQP